MILTILQARMSSTRLPGKVLKPLAGAPSLYRQIERLRLTESLDTLVVATSSEAGDDAIEAVCNQFAVNCFRGSLDNVLERFEQCAAHYGAKHVVRLTADCPLVDWRILERLIEVHLKDGCDYSSSALPRHYPRGLDAEVMTIDALKEAAAKATSDYEREHVTPYLYRPESTCRFGSVTQKSDMSPLRWTLDTAEDYAMISGVYDRLYPQNPAFTSEDILKLLLGDPALRSLNADEDAKAVYQELEQTARGHSFLNFS